MLRPWESKRSRCTEYVDPKQLSANFWPENLVPLSRQCCRGSVVAVVLSRQRCRGSVFVVVLSRLCCRGSVVAVVLSRQCCRSSIIACPALLKIVLARSVVEEVYWQIPPSIEVLSLI